MTSLKFKELPSGEASLAHPQAPLGYNERASVMIREVTDIPDGVTAAEVGLRYRTTAIIDTEAAPVLSVRHDMLGEGRIIRPTKG